MHHGGAGSRCLHILTACLLLSVIAVSDGLAGEWENMRESYDSKLRAHAKRIASRHGSAGFRRIRRSARTRLRGTGSPESRVP